MTGSQKVEGPNPSSSTKKTNKANDTSNYLSTTHNSNTQLAVPLHRLGEIANSLISLSSYRSSRAKNVHINFLTVLRLVLSELPG